MGLVQVTPPTLEPLTLGQAKSQLRLYHDADDADVLEYIEAARAWWENWCRRAMMQQTWQLTMRGFPAAGEPFPLAKGAIISVDGITYRHATTGAPTVLDPSKYVADLTVPNGMVEPAPSESWPQAQDHPAGVTVPFTCGYGAAGADVPSNVRQVMRLLMAHQYAQREPVALGTIATELPLGVRTFGYVDRLVRL